MKIYTYAKCDTCRKAVKWLREKGLSFEEIPIRETPPSPEELMRMLSIYKGDLRRLFNTSGQDYRALGMKDKLPSLTAEDAVALLAGNGNLIKRPFLLDGERGLVGFSAGEWEATLF
jgi:arsenate reductase (glutaredoxin)